MYVKEMTYYIGANAWCSYPTLEAELVAPRLLELPGEQKAALLKALPTLNRHVSGLTSLPELLTEIALELQVYTRTPRGLGFTSLAETPDSGSFKIAIQATCDSLEVVRTCLLCALALLETVMRQEPVKLYYYMYSILGYKDKLYGVSSYEVLKCIPKDVPWFKVYDEYEFYQIGYGVNQKRFWASETDRTGGIAETISKNKQVTKSLLQNAGIPVPHGCVVKDIHAAAEFLNGRTGYIAKPINGNNGKGITFDLGIHNLAAALAKARACNKEDAQEILLEKFCAGDHYRITAVQYLPVACSRLYVVTVKNKLIGDGRETLNNLIYDLFAHEFLEQAYQEVPEKDVVLRDFTNYYERMTSDYLAKHGYTYDTVLPSGDPFLLERCFIGYTPVDLAVVNPRTRDQCELACRIVDLDLCGIDLMIQDVTKPLDMEENGFILELNAGPCLDIHGNRQNSIGRAVLQYLLKDDRREGLTVPILSLGGEGNINAVNALLSAFCVNQSLYTASHRVNHMYLNNGVKAHCADVKALLMNNKVQVAVVNNHAEVIRSKGLFFTSCHAIVVGTTREPQSCLTLLSLVPKNGYAVLNLDDPNIEKYQDQAKGAIIFYTTKTLSVQRGDARLVYLDKDQVVLNFQGTTKVLGSLDTLRPQGLSDVDFLAAIGGLWTLVDLLAEQHINSVRTFMAAYQAPAV